MEEPLLHDPKEYPSDDVLRRHLGRTLASWRALIAHVEQDER